MYVTLRAGLLLRIPIWQQPKIQQIFDDSSYWELPDEGFPSTGLDKNANEQASADV